MNGPGDPGEAELTVDEASALLDELVQDPDFAQLAKETKTLNAFEAIGVDYRERRHSDFLAFLLNPSEPHGLDDLFVRRLVTLAQQVGLDLLPAERTGIDVPDSFPDSTEVHREWTHPTGSRFIDILILHPDEEWVCAIENKIRETDRGHQLDDCFELVESVFDGYEQVFIYLTPYGDPPERDSHAAYVPLSYEQVLESIEGGMEAQSDVLSDHARYILGDYIDLVRRRVMKDPKIQRLCRNVYARHREAVQLLVEYLPDMQSRAVGVIEDHLPDLLEKHGMVIGKHKNRAFYFWPEELEEQGLPTFDGRENRRILEFSLRAKPNRVRLHFTLRDGDEDLRRRIYQWARNQGPPFENLAGENPTKKNEQLYDRTIATIGELEEAEFDEEGIGAEELLVQRLEECLDKEVPQLVTKIRESDWFQSIEE